MPQASPYGKGRWHEVPEGIRGVVFDTANQIVQINPQKGRHLLCHFCPCEKRKQGETSRRRERKETGSQPQACRRCLSCLILPQTLVKFFLRKNLTKRRCMGRWHEVTEGIRRSDENTKTPPRKARAAQTTKPQKKRRKNYLFWKKPSAWVIIPMAVRASSSGGLFMPCLSQRMMSPIQPLLTKA